MSISETFCPECGWGSAGSGARFCPTDGVPLEKPVEEETVGRGTLVGGRFRVLEHGGSGAFASVHRALQVGSGRPVALKLLRADVDWDDTTNQRFVRESKAVATMNHPNIVRPVDFGHDREIESVYFAMDWIDGPDLREFLHEGPPTLATTLSLAAQICSALYEAHTHDIVHRDLKPGNAKVQSFEDGTHWVKVLDFGIAKELGGQSLTQTGRTVGTPRYTSPEQALGGELDGRSDLYALGVLLYQLLTGTLPFERDNDIKLMQEHVHRDPPDLRERAPSGSDVPNDLVDLVGDLLAKDPDDRPGDAIEVHGRLEDVRRACELTDPLLERGPH